MPTPVYVYTNAESVMVYQHTHRTSNAILLWFGENLVDFVSPKQAPINAFYYV